MLLIKFKDFLMKNLHAFSLNENNLILNGSTFRIIQIFIIFRKHWGALAWHIIINNAPLVLINMAQRSSWKFLGLINITKRRAVLASWFAWWLPRRSSDGRWAWEEIHLLSLAGNSHYVIINTRSLYLCGCGCQEAADRPPLPSIKKLARSQQI